MTNLIVDISAKTKVIIARKCLLGSGKFLEILLI